MGRIFNKLPTSGLLTWVLAHFVYKGQQYADFGVTVLPADYVQNGAPAIISLLYVLITEKLPSFKGTFDKILKMLSFGKVGLLAPPEKSPNNLLSLLASVEIQAAELGIKEVDVSAVRKAALSKVPEPQKPAIVPVPATAEAK